MRVVFVCLGNICRSPMAEAIFSRMAEEAGLDVTVDSCGTSGVHTGDPPHPRTLRILQEHGIEYDGEARRVEASDMDADYVVCMDHENQRAIEERFGKKTHLLLDFAEGGDVPDPYYTGTFSEVYDLIEEGCRGLLEQIRP